MPRWAGLVPEFTRVSNPYEEPEDPELVIDTTRLDIDDEVQQSLLELEHKAYLH